jgi:hypothetical protein
MKRQQVQRGTPWHDEVMSPFFMRIFQGDQWDVASGYD